MLSHSKMDLKVLDLQQEHEHFHQEIQLIYLLDGTMDLQIMNQKFKLEKDDIVVVNANKKHSHQATEDILYCEITISYQLIMDTIDDSGIIFWCNSTIDKNEAYDKLREIIKNLLNRHMLKTNRTNDFGSIGLLYYLLDVLSMNFVVSAQDKVDGIHRYDERIEQINNYIRSNYNRAISLNELAGQLYLSNAYLSRFFKKNYGMNFAEYLSNIRLFHAVDDLLYTNDAITKIALNNGFANVATFNKIFKKTYGKTPSVFRSESKKEQKNLESQDRKDATRKLEKYLREEKVEEFSDYAGKSEVIKVSTKQYHKYDKIWNQMINVGCAKDLIDSNMQEHIRRMKDVLKIQYVRFWDVFSSKMLISFGEEETSYNFSKLDTILDFLTSCGLKPFFELGQKPKRVQKNVKDILIYEEEETLFTSLAQWESVLYGMIRHFIIRYGKDEVSTWKFELWNDTRPGKQDDERQVSYVDMFRVAYTTIKKLLPKAEVGGFGSTATFQINILQEVIQQLKKEKIEMDFFSMLSYPYVEGEENKESFSKRSTDSKYLNNTITRVKEELEKQDFYPKKIYVTEWNLTISERNYINDSCFKGAYIVKNVIDNMDEVQLLGYFVGSDRFSEYYDSNLLLYGGTGLITKDGILKPAGFAFKFLNSLYSYFVEKGKNYIVTTDGNQRYAIVCHNCKNLSYYYYMMKEDEITKDKIWQCYDDRNSFDLDFNLLDLEDGEYKIKIQRVNQENGSVLNCWKEMNYYNELSMKDIDYLKRVVAPKREVSRIQVSNHMANIHIKLAPNEIASIKLEKLI